MSVIIPVFNRENFIGEAIDSVLRCAEVGEVIIVDDGSSDKTLEICESYSKKSSIVKTFWHSSSQNLGPSATRNLGIQKSKLSYIAFLDSDDQYSPNRFKVDKELFHSDSTIDAVFSCSAELGKQEDNSIYYGVSCEAKGKLDMLGDSLSFYKCVIRNKLILFDTNSVTFKRKFLVKNKLFDERLFLHEDTELWKRLLRIGRFRVGSCSDPVSFFRRHSKNSITSRDHLSKLKMWAVLMENIDIDSLHNFELEDAFKRICRLESETFKNVWFRRTYFYSQLLFYSLNPKKVLERTRVNYAKI